MKKLIQMLKTLFAGDADKIKELEEMEKDLENIKDKPEPMQASIPAAAGNSTERLEAQIAKLLEDNKKMVDVITEMQAKDLAREETIKNEAEKNRIAKINKLLEEAQSDGRIPPKNEDLKKNYKIMLEKDFEAGSKIIEALPKLAKAETLPTQQIKQNNTNTTLDRSVLIENAKEAFKTNIN